MDIVKTKRIRERIESDPAVRQRYEEMLAIAREILEIEAGEGDEREIIINATDIVFDRHPPQPVRMYDGDPHVPMGSGLGTDGVRWATISFPVATEDMGLRRDEMQFRYAMRETLAWLRGGITLPELATMGLREAWDTISTWVDGVRRVQPADMATLAARLRLATEAVCKLVSISEADIVEGLEGVQLVSSKVMGAPHEMVYRRALFVSIAVFQRRPWGDGVIDALDKMDDARAALLDFGVDKLRDPERR